MSCPKPLFLHESDEVIFFDFVVRQGSVLSPVLFDLLIDDVSHLCTTVKCEWRQNLYCIICWWYTVDCTICHYVGTFAAHMRRL